MLTQRLHNVYTTFGVALCQDTTQVSRHNARIKSDTTQVNKSGGRGANAALQVEGDLSDAPYLSHKTLKQGINRMLLEACICDVSASLRPWFTPRNGAGPQEQILTSR